MTATADKPILKAPFPAFGGKSTVADMVWERFGEVRNYVEPFAFSAAVLLRRPDAGPIETINDLNAYVANFWRAVAGDPDAVATYADNCVNETDLHARHAWLVNSESAKCALNKVRNDPEYFSAKIAGWWVWGACCWIGSGWCDDQRNGSDWHSRPDLRTGQGVSTLSQQLPHMDATRGIIAPPIAEQIAPKRPILAGEFSNGKGVNCFSTAKRPALCNGNTTYGQGVHGKPSLHQKRPIISADGSEFGLGINARPQLADVYSRGRGVNGNDSAGTCVDRRRWITDWMYRLADRLRPVRVCCGHWARICDSDSTLTRLGLTGAFLDPPYRKTIDGKKNRSAQIYANDASQCVNSLCDEVQAWALKWGSDPLMRIAVCGLEGEYPELDAAGWEKIEWKSRGGYGNRTKTGKENRERERIWFNASCAKPKVVQNLFSMVSGA